MSPEALALVISSLIFVVTAILVVRHWINFFITFLFLLFSLAAGVVVANYDLLRCYMESQQEELGSLRQEFGYLKKELEATLLDVQDALVEQRYHVRRVVGSARDLLDEMDEQKSAMRALMEEARLSKHPKRDKRESLALFQAPLEDKLSPISLQPPQL